MDGERARAWYWRCAGCASPELGVLLKNICGGQAEEENDRKKVRCRIDKLEE